MKKLIFFQLLLILFFITACSSEENAIEIQTVEASSDYAPNPQVPDDRKLLKSGQSVVDEKGEAILKRMSLINDTVEIGPIRLTIYDLKQIHLRPDYSLIDYFHGLTHEDEFDFVKVFVEIENTTAEPLHFAPIAKIRTSAGEEIEWNKDIYLEELNGKIEGFQTKKGNLGFIIESTKNLKWIEVITSDVFDINEKTVTKSKEIKLTF